MTDHMVFIREVGEVDFDVLYVPQVSFLGQSCPLIALRLLRPHFNRTQLPVSHTV